MERVAGSFQRIARLGSDVAVGLTASDNFTTAWRFAIDHRPYRHLRASHLRHRVFHLWSVCTVLNGMNSEIILRETIFENYPDLLLTYYCCGVGKLNENFMIYFYINMLYCSLQDILKGRMKSSMILLNAAGAAGFTIFCLMAIGFIPFHTGTNKYMDFIAFIFRYTHTNEETSDCKYD